MASAICDRAVQDALHYGKALLKFISPNDVGQTNSHQAGYYLPKPPCHIFTPRVPAKGVNYDDPVSVLWQDGRITSSRLKWYGAKKTEHRLTSFGKDFPFRTFDNVGDLLVLIPIDYANFLAYVLYDEEDIEEIRASLGLRMFVRWAIYEHGVEALETEDECVERKFLEFCAPLSAFPTGESFSKATLEILLECIKNFTKMPSDERLVECVDTEFKLFKRVERKICEPEINRMFKDVDDFIETAKTLIGRRKTRAGRSLENYVDDVLLRENIPHVMRPKSIDGVPDVVIPSEAAYHDSGYPSKKLATIGVKTSCKDRWRQVLNEAKRIPEKFILTLQPTISTKQLVEMKQANVTLVVPRKYRKDYPKDSGISLLTVEDFVQTIRERLG